MKVRVTKLGIYNSERKYPGDVFILKSPAHFSHKWMVEVDPETELKRMDRSQKQPIINFAV